jgi:fibro-slime domain-containing protein
MSAQGGASGLGGSAGFGGTAGHSGTAGGGGASGAAGHGGSAGSGGSAGHAGSGGSGGSAGVGGSGGSGGHGGTAGGGGAGTAGSGGSGGTGGVTGQCAGKVTGYLRDFTIANQNGIVKNAAATPPIAETVNGTDYAVSPDFEVVSHDASKQYASDPGMVLPTLGSDSKPVYAGPAEGTISTTGPANFATWFNDTAGVNLGEELDLQFTKDANKPTDANAYTFSSGPSGSACLGADHTYCAGFFPIDNRELGNEGNTHNYHMTFELHVTFKYHAGQVFSFTGDDDVWAFIDQKLGLDLGGVHLSETATVNLDTLGLTEGQTYPLDFFWCQRHVTASDFRIDTNLDVVDCGTIAK